MTVTSRLTPVTNRTPAIAEISSELSGSRWVARFPGSSNLDDLSEPFREAVRNFVSAMTRAGASIIISATLRPPERAYLMHWSWKIVHGTDPDSVPSQAGVNIEWVHATPDASIQAARAMVNGYGLQNLRVAPSLSSRHTQGLAIDMSISWSGNLSISDARGRMVAITSTPRTGMNPNLRTVGASYGVIKYLGGAADRPHWSNDGH